MRSLSRKLFTVVLVLLLVLGVSAMLLGVLMTAGIVKHNPQIQDVLLRETVRPPVMKVTGNEPYAGIPVDSWFIYPPK